MASARATICLPFFNDRRRGLAINANKIRDARSYAKSPPPGLHKLGDVDGRLRFCGRFAKGYSGAPSSPLRRKKSAVLWASNSLAAFRWSRNPAAAIAMAHDRSRQSLDGTSTPSRPPRRLMATVLLKHRSDLDPI